LKRNPHSSKWHCLASHHIMGSQKYKTWSLQYLQNFRMFLSNNFLLSIIVPSSTPLFVWSKWKMKVQNGNMGQVLGLGWNLFIKISGHRNWKKSYNLYWITLNRIKRPFKKMMKMNKMMILNNTYMYKLVIMKSTLC
jgi:hypothetical protein